MTRQSLPFVLDPYLNAKNIKTNEYKECVRENESVLLKPKKAEIDFNAGKIIGVLERIIIFCLVASNNYTVIAIVIAAKTAVRFKNLEDQCFSEYYLIGTLSSVIVALLFGALWNFLGVYI